MMSSDLTACGNESTSDAVTDDFDRKSEYAPSPEDQDAESLYYSVNNTTLYCTPESEKDEAEFDYTSSPVNVLINSPNLEDGIEPGLEREVESKIPTLPVMTIGDEEWNVLSGGVSTTIDSGRTHENRVNRRDSVLENFDPLRTINLSAVNNTTLERVSELDMEEVTLLAAEDQKTDPLENNNNFSFLFFERTEVDRKSNQMSKDEVFSVEKKKLEDDLKAKEEKIKELEARLSKASKNEGLEHVVAEYEKTMSAGVRELDDWKVKVMNLEHEKLGLIRERDQAVEDLRNVETAFSDVHSKYERAKVVLRNFQDNQEVLEQRDLEMQGRLGQSQKRIIDLEEEVKNKITLMYDNFESRLKNQEIDSTRLRAQLRKAEMKNETLEHDVRQKNSEISKLNTLCDELINHKVD